MLNFCESPLYGKRLRTKTVFVGNVPIGGNHPIVIQSMTNTDPLDTKSSVEQIRRLADAGCQIVRLATPSMESARNLENIRNKLVRLSCDVPIVADVHFQSKIAFEVVKYADKVRINPGNFYEKVKFKNRDYTDELNNEALKHIEEEFVRLIEQAKPNGVALRIGVNHGSLSERIMKRFGNTVEGMVESAMEYLTIARRHNFEDIVFSMKSSDTPIMIEAYRLLVDRMRQTGECLPLHLGVTEAGFGIDARIKSAVGIGSLMADGIGDTIRVSLTEPPVNEIPVARQLIELYRKNYPKSSSTSVNEIITNDADIESLFDKRKREQTSQIQLKRLKVGGDSPVRVELNINNAKDLDLPRLENYAQKRDTPLEAIRLNANIVTVEILHQISIYNASLSLDITAITQLKEYCNIADKINVNLISRNDIALLREAEAFCQKYEKAIQINFNALDKDDNKDWSGLADEVLSQWTYPNTILGVVSDDVIHDYRLLLLIARKYNLNPMLNLISPKLPYQQTNKSEKSLTLKMASELGSLLVDGFGSIITLNLIDNNIDEALNKAYTILQASGVRFTKTEFVSCPSCGRTQFDIEKTSAIVKQHTEHLIGVKIAVMGCIVNGPGEMGDADFGYIGSGKGKVNLYVKGECVRKGIPEGQALDELINLIKEQGKWIDPPN